MDHRLLSSPARHFLLLFHGAKNKIQIFAIISRNWALEINLIRFYSSVNIADTHFLLIYY